MTKGDSFRLKKCGHCEQELPALSEHKEAAVFACQFQKEPTSRKYTGCCVEVYQASLGPEEGPLQKNKHLVSVWDNPNYD